MNLLLLLEKRCVLSEIQSNVGYMLLIIIFHQSQEKVNMCNIIDMFKDKLLEIVT